MQEARHIARVADIGEFRMKLAVKPTRRQFIRTASISTAAISIPWIIPAGVLGKGVCPDIFFNLN